ncbi:MAG: response regulator, partial [Spirochaetaceae bacterium]
TSVEDWKNLVTMVSTEKKLVQHELHLINSDNTAVTATGTVTGKFNRKGKLVDLQFSVADISHRRRLENELSNSLKMEAVGRLAGGVAHDFNNIIAVILGYSEILMENLGNTPFKNDIVEIRRAAEKAADIAKQLLYFSRKQVERPSIINLMDSIQEMEKMLRRLIGENIQLFMEFNTKEAFVAVDKGQIEQVLMNLVLNARDAMPRGGIIRLLIREDKPETGQPQVILEVTDSGTGMSEEIKEHIFDPFFSTKENGKGTGLGLATVDTIISGAGGKINVQSAPGKGSVFSLSFPKATAIPDHMGKAAAPVSKPNMTERILVVEDDKNIRLLIAKILGYHGYEVSQAEDGNAAMKAVNATEKEFDLIILDMIMPGMTGKETSELLRKRYPGLPILFISGYTDDTLIKNGCKNDKLTDFITKPFDSDTLQKKVHEIIERKNGGAS